MKKHFLKKAFLSLVTSGTYSIRLTDNLSVQIDSGYPGLSFGYLTILLASTVIEIIATFRENSPILRKKKSKNLPRPIERRLPHVAIFLTFRVIWGGGGVSTPGSYEGGSDPRPCAD